MTGQITIDPTKTAVIIMDYQNRQLGNFSEKFQNEILQRANNVLDGCRSKNIPVMYVEVVRGDRTPEIAIHEAIIPKSGEKIFTKSRTGPFSTTDIDAVLKELGIETLALMGISTSGCVLTTVRWAYDIDYSVVVLSDCCADRDEEVHRVLMEKLFPRQSTVVTSDQFLNSF